MSGELLRILHVDDSFEDRELIRIKLEKIAENLVIQEADSGSSALKLINNGNFDCILSDFQMPGMDGLNFLSRLRDKGIETPFIFLTGQGNESIAAAAFRAGADDYYTKDAGFANFDRLLNSVRKLTHAHYQSKEKHKTEQDLRLKIKEFQILYETSQNINTFPSIEKVVKYAISGLFDSINPDLIAVFFLNESNALVPLAVSTKVKNDDTLDFPIHTVGECLCGIAVRDSQFTHSVDIDDDPRCNWKECKQAGFKSFAAVPMTLQEKIFGVIGVGSLTARDFSAQKEFLETMAFTLAVGANNSMMITDSKQ